MASGGTVWSGKVWEWQRDDGGYSPFPPQDSAEIESAYSTGVRTHTVHGYMLDFSRMTQKNSTSGEFLSSILHSREQIQNCVYTTGHF